MTNLLFLKLGGSLLTDKTAVEVVRQAVVERLATEIKQARLSCPELQLVIGHGSGSFGHVAAARHGTRSGAATAAEWQSYAEVSDAAARLNSIIRKALLAAGVPVVTLQPSASAICHDGRITSLAVEPVQSALSAGLIPLVYGDVAFDHTRGGTIISTEEILSYLAGLLRPSWLLLAGETAGVLDTKGRVISAITGRNLKQYEAALGGSRGTDVTGGMIGKVEAVLALSKLLPELSIRIFSGLEPRRLQSILEKPEQEMGTLLKYQ